jgi:glucose-1-phosphate adenylyltransferase
VQVDPVFNLYDPEWPLRTYQPQFPPAKFVFSESGRTGHALDSIVSMGCILSGSEIQRSVLSPGVRVHSFCDIEDSILLPNTVINRHSRIRRAIIDRNVVVPRGAVIGYDLNQDRRRHTVTEGGVVVVSESEECFVDASLAVK